MFNNRSPLAISTVLLVYTALIILTVSMAGFPGRPEPTTIYGPLLGIACLYGAVLYLLLSTLSSLRQNNRQLRQTIRETEQKLETINQDHDQDLEKRTLEIAVINASLNREIAERMQAEAEARELHRQMELILNSAGEGIFGLDASGNVTFANTAALLMIGWEAEELVGRPHHDLVHHSHADGSPHDRRDCPISQAYRDGIVHSGSDDVFWTKDGSSFPVEYVSTPILENGQVKGAVVVFRDTSTFA